jgi:hypothetical protein
MWQKGMEKIESYHRPANSQPWDQLNVQMREMSAEDQAPSFVTMGGSQEKDDRQGKWKRTK